jgi:hypothetical protein
MAAEIEQQRQNTEYSILIQQLQAKIEGYREKDRKRREKQKEQAM